MCWCVRLDPTRNSEWKTTRQSLLYRYGRQYGQEQAKRVLQSVLQSFRADISGKH